MAITFKKKLSVFDAQGKTGGQSTHLCMKLRQASFENHLDLD